MKEKKNELTQLKTLLNYKVYLRKDPIYSRGWQIRPVFAIVLHNNDVSLLENISTCLRYPVTALRIKFSFFLDRLIIYLSSKKDRLIRYLSCNRDKLINHLSSNRDKNKWVKINRHLSIFFTLAFFIFIPYGANINVFNYMQALLCLNLLGIIIHYIYTSYLFHNKELPGIDIVPGYIDRVISDILNESIIPDYFTCILLFIGLSMLMYNLTLEKSKVSIKDRIKLLIKNWKTILVIVIGLIILRIILVFFGIFIINTDNFILFIVSVFSRVVLFQLIIAVTFCIYFKKIDYNLFSLNILTVLFTGCIFYLYLFIITPFIYTSFYPWYVNHYSGSLDAWIKMHSKDISDFLMQSSKVLCSNPIFRKLFTMLPLIKPRLLSMKRIPFSDIYSLSFKRSYHQWINSKSIFTPVRSSKFRSVPVYVFKPISLEHSTIVNIKCSLPNVKYSLLNITQLIYDSNFINRVIDLSNRYQNVSCKIHLTCSDHEVKASFDIQNLSLQKFFVKVSPILEKKNKFSSSDFTDFGKNELDGLISNASPPKELLSLQVYMEQSDYHVPSTIPTVGYAARGPDGGAISDHVTSNVLSSTNEPSFIANTFDLSIDPSLSNLGQLESFPASTFDMNMGTSLSNLAQWQLETVDINRMNSAQWGNGFVQGNQQIQSNEFVQSDYVHPNFPVNLSYNIDGSFAIDPTIPQGVDVPVQIDYVHPNFPVDLSYNIDDSFAIDSTIPQGVNVGVDMTVNMGEGHYTNPNFPVDLNLGLDLNSSYNLHGNPNLVVDLNLRPTQELSDNYNLAGFTSSTYQLEGNQPFNGQFQDMSNMNTTITQNEVVNQPFMGDGMDQYKDIPNYTNNYSFGNQTQTQTLITQNIGGNMPVTVNPPVGQTSSVLDIKGKRTIGSIPITIIDSNKEVEFFPTIKLAAEFLNMSDQNLSDTYLDTDKVWIFNDKFYKIKKGDLRNQDFSSEIFDLMNTKRKPVSLISPPNNVQFFPKLDLAADFLETHTSSLSKYYVDKDKVFKFKDKLYKIKKGDLRNQDFSSEIFEIKLKGTPVSLISSSNKVEFFPQIALAADFLKASPDTISKYMDKDKTFNFEDKLYKIKMGDLRNQDFSSEIFKRVTIKKNPVAVINYHSGALVKNCKNKKEASDLLGVSKGHVANYIKNGKPVTGKKLKGLYYIRDI